MNWGMAQTPPLFKKSPFHRFGVRMNKKAETMRDRRLSRDEEKRLLDAALQKMNTREHQFVGPLLHDRIIGALELVLPARRDAADPEQARELGDLPDRHPWRDGEGQGEPAHSVQSRRDDSPRSSSARATLGPDAYVFGTGDRRVPAEHPDRLGDAAAAGARHRAEARRGRAPTWNREQLQRIDLRWHDLRHEGACRLLADGVDIRIIQLMLGHASIQQTQRYLNVTDEELRRGLEVSWNNKGRPLRLASGA